MIKRYFLNKLMILLVLFIIVVAAVIPFIEPTDSTTPSPDFDTPQKRVKPPIINEPTAEEMIEELEANEVPDFSTFKSVSEKKNAFFTFLKPYVRQENARIAKQRKKIKAIIRLFEIYGRVWPNDRRFLAKMYENYKLERATLNKKDLDKLLKRVDGIPEGLVLMQAANESAWGTSRFAKQGNNYFGQWCYRKGCGLVPLQRTEGMNHEVAKFDDISGSVRSYFRNINTNPAYKGLRDLRAQLRVNNLGLKSELLAPGLISYSERGSDYVEDLLNMIRVNKRYISEE